MDTDERKLLVKINLNNELNCIRIPAEEVNLYDGKLNIFTNKILIKSFDIKEITFFHIKGI